LAKILIVEDEEAIADLEKDYLENASFQVDLAIDGEQGYHLALTGKYDLIILDVMLPKMDGFTLLKKIREDQNIPILLVTAKKEDIDKIRGLGLGADDYITKPFSPGELVARVKAHLNRYQSIIEDRDFTGDVLHIRGIKLDKTARRVFVSGQEKRLTTKEFDLLLFFMEHPNQVFTKEELFKEVWDNDYYGDIATVVVHIKKLREKIEADPVNPQYIVTVWGCGYRFKV
jgi:DNA-binding response OmpR family regulator